VQHTDNSQSQLAKLLASENITVRHMPGIDTASFDTKNRVLALPMWKDVSKDLYDLLLVHEVGHALDTPATWLKDLEKISKEALGRTDNSALEATKDFINIVEDARIDKRQKRRYPGSRRNYFNGYNELWDRDFFGTANMSDAEINGLSFIDRFNIYYKGGQTRQIEFTPEEKAFVTEGEYLETWADVTDFTKRILAFAKDQLTSKTAGDGLKSEDGQKKSAQFSPADANDSNASEAEDIDLDEYDDESKESFEKAAQESLDNQEKAKDKGSKSDKKDDQESEDGKEGSESKKGQKSTGKPEKKDGEGEDAGEGTGSGKGKGDNSKPSEKDTTPTNEDGNGKPNPNGDGARGNSNGSSGPLPTSSTRRVYEESLKSLLDRMNNIHYRYFHVPMLGDTTQMIDDYPVVMEQHATTFTKYDRSNARANFMTWKNNEKPIISYLVKEFEMYKAADEHKRTSVSRTGMIDMMKLPSYKFTDDVFLRQNIITEGKNHGFVMFLDWSSSMEMNIFDTVKQVLSLSMFCRQVQIPFEVYTFRDPNDRYDSYSRHSGNQFRINPKFKGEDNISFDDFKLRNMLSSRMSASKFQEAMLNFYMLGSGNRGSRDTLTGTPLNQAIFVADKIIKEFRKRNKIQIMNVLFLTDGGSNPGRYSSNSLGGYGHTMIDYLVDDVTGINHPFVRNNSISNPRETTEILLRILKDRNDINLLGYFLASRFNTSYDTSVVQNATGFSIPDVKLVEKVNKDWRENGFVGLKGYGYDTYFLLNTKNMDTSSGTNFEVESAKWGDKKSGLYKAFSEVSRKKVLNRVLLKQFISMIVS